MERLSHVHDSTGNLIFFIQYLSDDNSNLIKISNEQYVKAVKTLSTPAIIIDLDEWQIRYYYHATSYDQTLLIGISFINGIWQVKEFYENPSGEFVLNLLKNYLQKGGVKVLLQNEVADNQLENF